MNNQTATLIAHCGTEKVSREDLKAIPLPEETKTHKPVAHFEIVEKLEEALSFRYLKVIRDEYAVSKDGMKMFGVMDLDAEFTDCRFSIGLRNSNDKSMRLALTAGLRVIVCDNMAFSGDFTPLSHKHTSNLELTDAISIAVDRIHRGFEPLKEQVQAMKDLDLTDAIAKLIIYQAFVDKKVKGIPKHLMELVHRYYFKPKYKPFEERNLWSLSNAFTSSFKKLKPIKQFETTARLGTFLSDVQDDLGQELELKVTRPVSGSPANSNVIRMTNERGDDPDSLDNSNAGIKGLPGPSDDEDFDEDDIPEDPFSDRDYEHYFDEEEAMEEIDEAEEEMMEEYLRRAA